MTSRAIWISRQLYHRLALTMSRNPEVYDKFRSQEWKDDLIWRRCGRMFAMVCG